MIVLGKKYIFNELEKEYLNKKIVYVKPKKEEIEKIISHNNFEYIILNTDKADNELIKYLTSLELKGHKFLTIEHFLENYLYKLYVPNNNTKISYLEEIKPYNKIEYFIKRIIDFSVSIPLLIFTSPIMAYAAYKIKKESPEGPIIFKQKRVGKGGKEFVCYKFRSMIPDAEKEKPQFASKNDPRIFKWGAFMRKTRIDELPQLINVLKGEMHLVGPRPERKYWIDIFEKEIPYYNQRHLVAPGITGWAQVNYPYGENALDAKQKLMYDLFYIKNWSIWLEIKTLFKTFQVVLEKRGV